MAVGHIIAGLMEKNVAASINKDNNEWQVETSFRESVLWCLKKK